MKILVAGGGGYIGSSLVPSLVERGYEVEVIDLFWFGDHLPEDVKKTNKDLFQCTVSDLEGFDQIIFLAGLSNDPMAEFDPKKNFTDNGALPSYLAFLAKKANVKRFIYASSCSVYGYTVDKLYDEESPVTSNYPYGISKLQGERGCLQLHDDGFSVIALRQGTVSGYSPRMRLDLIINTMFMTAMRDGKIIVNNPSIWRPIYDVRDCATAFIRAVQAHESINGVFNVSSGNYTVGQVADLVKTEIEHLTNNNVSLDIKNIQDFRNYKVTTDKALTVLGFQPQYEVKDIIRHLYDNKNKFNDFNNYKYYNIDVFKKLVQKN